MDIKLKKENLSYDYYNSYVITVDKYLSADVYISAYIYNISNDIGVYNIELKDVDTTFYINGMKAQFMGYKQLYVSLFGIVDFDIHLQELEDLAFKKFKEELEFTPLLENLTPTEAKKIIKKLLKNKEKYKTLMTNISKDNEDDNFITYSSNHIILKLIKQIDKKLVSNHLCLCTYNKNKVLHSIANVSQFLNK
tara:strand:- start:1030 stop:1611 length:582 start_codon:yes stop_codon:yes gene_type:complete